uniref:Pre-mRNA-splicing factor 38B n=1 Tax=Pavo cristatus TaxID=9049 RepID=A0A8C9EKJ1_PAVCR
MANNSPAVGAGNCQGQQAAQHQPGAVPPAQQQLQSGAPKPAASGKQGNVLPLWGNEKTMNLNPMILTNILSSPYFKVQLYELKTYHEVVDEIYFKVRLRAAAWAPRGAAGACPEPPRADGLEWVGGDCGLCRLLSALLLGPLLLSSGEGWEHISYCLVRGVRDLCLPK